MHIRRERKTKYCSGVGEGRSGIGIAAWLLLSFHGRCHHRFSSSLHSTFYFANRSSVSLHAISDSQDSELTLVAWRRDAASRAQPGSLPSLHWQSLSLSSPSLSLCLFNGRQAGKKIHFSHNHHQGSYPHLQAISWFVSSFLHIIHNIWVSGPGLLVFAESRSKEIALVLLE